MTFKIIINDNILANDDSIASLLYQYSRYWGVIEGVTSWLLGEVIKVLKLFSPPPKKYSNFYTLFNTFKNTQTIPQKIFWKTH